MLRCYATDTQGRVHSLPALCSLRISESADIPADSLRILLYGVYEEEFLRIFVYDEEELVTVALVDEQIAKVGSESVTQLICRSTAAVLLDNEAKPGNFVNPSCELMFRAYASPYGFSDFYGDNKFLKGEFSVAKGVSCYEALQSFSQAVFGKSLRVKGDEVYFEGDPEKAELYFSNKGEGLPFTEFTYNRLRCRQISKIYVKRDGSEDYRTPVADDDAIERDIQRERYMDISSYAAENISDVYRALAESKARSEEISLVYPGKLTGVVSACVKISVQGKVYEDFEVSSLDYTLHRDSEHTRLTLHRKEN